MTYKYKTKPYDHQHEEFTQHGKDPFRGLFWEQGVGKTKPVIDSTAYLYGEKEIDGLCVIAPNGVHRNWVSDEIVAHMPDHIAERMQSHIWYSTDTKKHARSFGYALNHDGLACLVMSYNAIWTNRGRDAWKAFLKKRRCMYVLDESQRVKNPSAKWSKRLLGSATVGAPYRRTLSGTPVTNSPFDIYNQLRFLVPNIWHQFGIREFSAFKQYFGIWEQRYISEEKSFPHCVAYKNLNTLHQILHEVGTRLTKDEVLDLPPKQFSKRYYDLTSTQKRAYQQLRDDFVIELENGEITAMLAIVRLLRFQQICCGYLPTDDDNPTLRDLPGGNPRLALLVDTIDELPHKAIIWARFTRDIDLITQHPKLKNRCVFVDGRVTGPRRGEALDAFQKGNDVQFLVASAAAIGTGVTLTAARTVVYYSNYFDLELRLQSEDRAHRIGQEHPVNYIDLCCPKTVDVQIIESLRKKVGVASVITGDVLKEWI